jgi:hypothetical protein
MESYIREYKITLLQQLIILTPMLFTNLVLIIGGIYFFKFSFNVLIIIYAIFFFIDMLPTIIIHVQYWIKNHGAVLTINTETKELFYKKHAKQVKYSFTDIDLLQYYRNLGKGSGWNSFGQYRYYKITFNDKKQIVITCLMINNIENTLEMLLQIKAERHSKLLCLVD